jgi:hypothetical protein
MSTSFPVPAPRVTLFNNAQQFFWSNGTPFNGFCLIGLVFPSASVTVDSYSEIDYGNLYPSLGLPRWQRVPIINGCLNASCGLFYNSDITPPGSAYFAYYYDSTGTQIAGPTSTFTVTTGAGGQAVTPPLLTLTLPSLLGPLPQPDSGPGADGDA